MHNLQREKGKQEILIKADLVGQYTKNQHLFRKHNLRLPRHDHTKLSYVRTSPSRTNKIALRQWATLLAQPCGYFLVNEVGWVFVDAPILEIGDLDIGHRSSFSGVPWWGSVTTKRLDDSLLLQVSEGNNF